MVEHRAHANSRAGTNSHISSCSRCRGKTGEFAKCAMVIKRCTRVNYCKCSNLRARPNRRLRTDQRTIVNLGELRYGSGCVNEFGKAYAWHDCLQLHNSLSSEMVVANRNEELDTGVVLGHSRSVYIRAEQPAERLYIGTVRSGI